MGPLSDLLWSDPDEKDGWSISPRGAGFIFGPNITKKFLSTNNIESICRAHQLAMKVMITLYRDITGLITVKYALCFLHLTTVIDVEIEQL